MFINTVYMDMFPLYFFRFFIFVLLFVSVEIGKTDSLVVDQ